MLFFITYFSDLWLLFFCFLFFITGEENFFEKKLFFPRTPIFQKTYREGRIIYCCFVRSTVERIMFAPHPRVKVLVKLFQKLARVWGE